MASIPAATAWRRLLGPGLGFACGLVAASVVAGAMAQGGQASGSAFAPPPPSSLAAPEQAKGAGAAVPEAVLLRLARLEAAVAAVAETSRRSEAQSSHAPQSDRFLAAALLLQASVATPRPWMREYQAMADLAPPGSLPRPIAEVLLSHAARGLPSEAELRERFNTLSPQLLARAPRQGNVLDQSVGLLRSSFASIGLTAPPPPTDQELAIAGVAQQLRRGNLAAAVADAAALEADLQPLLGGWIAQVRARLGVEQAVQETLLRILARPVAGRRA